MKLVVKLIGALPNWMPLAWWGILFTLCTGIPLTYYGFQWAVAKFVVQDGLCDSDYKNGMEKLIRTPETYLRDRQILYDKYRKCQKSVDATKGTLEFGHELIGHKNSSMPIDK